MARDLDAPPRWLLKRWLPRSGDGPRLHGVGVREDMPAGIVDRPRGTGDWFLAVFPDGVRIDAGDGLRDRSGPQRMAWSPGMGHRYGRPDRRWLHSWCHLGGVDVLARRAGLAPGLRAIADPGRIEDVLRALHREGGRARPDPDVIAALAEALLRIAAGDDPPQEADDPYERVRRHIDAHACERLTLADLARIAGRSPGQLCTGFRRRFGRTPIDYLIERRLAEAEVLLADPRRTVAEVAAALGWTGPRHFARLHRARLGRCPRGHSNASHPD